MPSYEFAGEVAKVADKVIATCHPHLANAEVCYLFRDPPAKSRGKVRLGQAKLVGKLETAVLAAAGVQKPFDFIVEIARAPWDDMKDDTRAALLDHELAHCVVVFDEEGARVGWALAGHDLEEFVDVVRRRGLWRDDVREFAGAVEALRKAGHPSLQVLSGGKTKTKVEATGSTELDADALKTTA